MTGHRLNTSRSTDGQMGMLSFEDIARTMWESYEQVSNSQYTSLSHQMSKNNSTQVYTKRTPPLPHTHNIVLAKRTSVFVLKFKLTHKKNYTSTFTRDV